MPESVSQLIDVLIVTRDHSSQIKLLWCQCAAQVIRITGKVDPDPGSSLKSIGMEQGPGIDRPETHSSQHNAHAPMLLSPLSLSLFISLTLSLSLSLAQFC